jgi:Skp family chaperone for outer membrane proteins
MKTPHILFTCLAMAFACLWTASTRADEVAPGTLQTPATTALRIGTVDMQELFKQYYRTNEAQKQINVERARIQKDNNERLQLIRELEEDLGNLRKQIEDPSIADSKKQTLFKDWQMKQQEGIALDRERREFLQRRNTALNEKMVQRMKGILEEIRKLVEEQAKLDNYDFVFDKSGLSTSQVPFLLYNKDATDVTAIVLKDLNKDAPQESGATESGTGDALKTEQP